MRTVLVLLLTLVTLPSFAQVAEPATDAATDERARAQALLLEALPLLQEQRYVEARDLLRDSLELVEHQSTAYNLAMAQRELGEAKIASEIIERLLAGEYEGELSEEQLGLIHELRRQVEADIARVTVTLEPEGADGVVFIDDEAQGPASEGPFPANPGEHVVRIASEGNDARFLDDGPDAGDSTTVTLRRGEELSLVFELTPRPVEEPIFVEAPPRRGWIAGVVIGAALLVGGAVALGLYFAGQVPDPENDPIFGRTETLRFGR